jgi:hypothetical protein
MEDTIINAPRVDGGFDAEWILVAVSVLFVGDAEVNHGVVSL